MDYADTEDIAWIFFGFLLFSPIWDIKIWSFFSFTSCTHFLHILAVYFVRELLDFFFPLSLILVPPSRVCTYRMSFCRRQGRRGRIEIHDGNREEDWEAKLAFFTLFGGGVFLILVFLVCFPLPLISFLASQRKSDEICISLYVSNQYGSLFIFSS